MNELRLGGAVAEAGFAGSLAVDVEAGDVARGWARVGGRGARFRNPGEAAGRPGVSEKAFGATASLGRLLPATWRIDAPLTVAHERQGRELEFLERSDVVADRIPGVRDLGAEETRVAFALRRVPEEGGAAGASMRLEWRRSAVDALTSREEATGITGAIRYDAEPAERSVDAVPGVVESLLRALLPRAIEESRAFSRLADARVRWSPERVGVSGAFESRTARTWRYEGLVPSPTDPAAAAVVSPREEVEGGAHVAFRPFTALSAALGVTTTRDLLDPARATTSPEAREALEGARTRIGGVDVGWERRRAVTTRVDFRPVLAPWLRPAAGYAAAFRTDRSPAYRTVHVADGDTTQILQRAAHGERRVSASLALDPGGLARALGAESDVFGIVETTAVEWSNALGSRFARASFDPTPGLQLGLGGRDAFRVVGADTAASVDAHDALRARAALRLPGRGRLEVEWAEETADLFDRYGGARAHERRTWPDARVTWGEVPVPIALRGALAWATASVGYQESTWIERFGGTARRGTEWRVPVQLSLGLAGGARIGYTGHLQGGEHRDATGAAQTSVARHDLRLDAAFAAPRAFRATFPAPIRASAAWSLRTERQCRVPASGEEPCTPYVDRVDRQADVLLETVVSWLNVGVQIAWEERVSWIGTRPEHRGVRLRIFGEFNVAAGTFGAR